METKKGPLARQVPLCLNDRAWGWKTLCSFLRAPLGLNEKWHMPWWTEKGVICLPNSGQVVCYWSELCFSSKVFFLVANDRSCFLISITHHLCWKEWATLGHNHILLLCNTRHFIFFIFHCLVQCLANITIAIGANDPRVQSPLCSLSNSHLMTSWLDVCIKQMWLAMRGLKQDRTAYSL